jgi:AmiR/NasT family two-component response regulator
MDGLTTSEGTASVDERLRSLVSALAERNRQLEHALEARIVIEQAKGVLAERWGVPPDRAFELLRQAARSNRVRVRDLASRVVSTPGTPAELAEVAPR